MKQTNAFYLGAVFKKTLFIWDINRTDYLKKKVYFCPIR